ncbi:MAG: aminotransferase class IV [Cytophagales bacterium]|nr:aminotransferase class IV [Cytophagales bacterium]
MIHYFNGLYIPSDTLMFPATDRAFQYGDGLFESIVIREQNFSLLPLHLNRLRHGANLFQITYKEELNKRQLAEIITELTAKNRLTGDLRVKLMLWRKEGGLYTPESREGNLLITVKDWSLPLLQVKEALGICENVRLSRSPLSACKLISAAPYVLASLEKKAKGADELVLTDAQGNVAECISSNLFWKTGSNWYTPGLETGCLPGTMRQRLIEWMKINKMCLKTGLYAPEQLKQADCIVSTNTASICFYQYFLDKKLTTDHSLFDRFK